MRTLAFSGLFSILLTLSACGIEALDGKAPEALGPGLPALSISATSLSETTLKGLSSESTCSNLADCPSEVAMLVTASKYSVSWCTAFMISEDVAATNAHCIPDSLRVANADCTGRIWLSFYKTSTFPQMVVGCEKVLYVSYQDIPTFKDVETAPDLALIRLNTRPARGILPLSSKGLKSGSETKIYRINPDTVSDDKMRGSLEPLNCKITSTTASALESRTATELDPCPVIHGNSGSPVLFEGQVYGIIFGHPEGTTRSYATDFLKMKATLSPFLKDTQ